MSKALISLVMFTSLVAPNAIKEANLVKPLKADAVYNEKVTLRLLNVEDYIYERDPKEPDTEPDLVDQFVTYIDEEYHDMFPKGVAVSYETTDTPESMFNLMKLSQGSYDLVCPSDYMIQKLIVNDMIMPMNIDEEHMPNYIGNASSIKDRLDAISAVNGKTGETCYLANYAVGYMWGTLGLLFDPAYGGRDPEQTIEDMQEWDVLWNPDYKGISSIKDSVRDTYAIGLLHAFDDEFAALKESYDKGEITAEKYNEDFSELFNKCDNETLDKVRQSLTKLKGNVFGMEVDSGKQDIVTGKIGINFAWSGDAVYSMEQAEEEKELELYYSIPNTGSNLWMDAWCMPKSNRSEAQTTLAELFLDFLSIPEYTAQNMEYTGYTPFTAGNEILDLTRSWYDYRYDEETEEFDDEFAPTAEEIEELGLQKIDLSYFFDGTLTDEDGNPLSAEESAEACVFYSDCYLPDAETDAEGNIVGGNRAVGRNFFCQFPDEETLVRCAVMRDFGSQNEAVLKMWEKFKSDALPVWAIVLFIVEVSAALVLVLYFVIGKRMKYSLRKKRKEEVNKK